MNHGQEVITNKTKKIKGAKPLRFDCMPYSQNNNH